MPAAADWYLREWLAHFKKRQAALVTELGWERSRAHHVFHSRQQYRREDVAAVSAWLKIAPHELMMPPAEALALRRLRETAKAIADASGSVTSDAAGGSAAK